MILPSLGAFSAFASEMPRAVAAVLSVAAIVYGVALARREARRRPRLLVWPIGGAPLVDDVKMSDVRLQMRGPLAFLQWRNDAGRVERLSWWGDTLSADERRELTLASAAAIGARRPTTMAP